MVELVPARMLRVRGPEVAVHTQRVLRQRDAHAFRIGGQTVALCGKLIRIVCPVMLV